MIIDKQNLFSEDQAITVTADSTNVIDLGNDHANVQALNSKGDLEVFVQCTAQITGGTSVKVGLFSSDTSTFSSETTISESGVILPAVTVAGYQFKMGKLADIDEQYLKLKYTVVGTHSAGTVLAGLILDRQTNV